jgi:MFS family permease
LTGEAVGLVLAAFAPGFLLTLAALVFTGMMGSCTNSASGRAVMGWFGKSERGTALGIRQMATPLGGGLAAASLPFISLAFGLRGGLLALAVLSLLAAVACGLWIRTPPAPAVRPVGTRAASPMRDRRIWRIALGGSLLVGGQLSIINYLVLFLNVHRGVPLAVAAGLLAVVQFGGAGARVAVGYWSDRRGERLGLMRLIALAGTASFVLVAALAEAPLGLLVPALVVTGVIGMSSNGLGFTATGEIAGLARAATAMGFQNTGLFVAGTVFPIAFGAIASSAGWTPAFGSAALLAALGWWVLNPLERLESVGWHVSADVAAS